MGIGALTLISVLAAGTYGLYYDYKSKSKKADNLNSMINYLDNELSNLGDIPLNDYFSLLTKNGTIDEKQYSKAIEELNNYMKKSGKDWSAGWEHFSRSEKEQLLNDLYKWGRESGVQMEELFKKGIDYIPEFKAAAQRFAEYTPEKVREQLYASMPQLQDAPAPTYLDTSFENYEMPVEDPYLYTSKELADMHGFEFDPNAYYDLIKQATSAEVDRAKFESDLMQNAFNTKDTERQATYLDNIRNTKQDAISKGLTSGQRAANEVLANVQAITNRQTESTDLATQRLNAVQSALEKDAKARLTANDYWNDLSLNLGSLATNYFDSDVYRYSQDKQAAANIWASDEALRAQRILANLTMQGNQIAANGAIQSYRNNVINQANSLANEYATLRQIALDKNNGNIYAALKDYENQLNIAMNGYPNYLSYVDIRNQANKNK